MLRVSQKPVHAATVFQAVWTGAMLLTVKHEPSTGRRELKVPRWEDMGARVKLPVVEVDEVLFSPDLTVTRMLLEDLYHAHQWSSLPR
jgi:hypothetical protein